MTARLLGLVDRLTDFASLLAVLALAALFLLGAAEIAARALFGGSLGFALEYSGYLVALVLLLGGGRTLREGGHIRMRLLADRLPPRPAAIADFAATLAGLILATLLALALADHARGSFLAGSRSWFPSATPLWLPQSLLAFGAVSLALGFLARLIRLARGDRVAP